MAQKKVYLSNVLLIAAGIIIGLVVTAMLYWPTSPELSKTVVEAEAVPCAPVPCTPITKEIPCTPVPKKDPCADRTTPVLYEGEFPGTAKGPAIIEWWDGGPDTPEHEGYFILNTGETFEYPYRGHYWVFCSRAALDQRYPDHVKEFLKKWPMDQEGRPPNQ